MSADTVRDFIRRAGPHWTVFLEAERPRLFLWTPVIFGIGVAAYYGWPAEPPAAVPAVALLLSLSFAVLRRGSIESRAFIVLALGFAAAFAATGIYGTPMLDRPYGPVTVTGHIADLEQHGEGERLLLDQVTVRGLDAARTPRRLHLIMSERILRKAGGLVPGDYLQAVAQLLPMSEPLAPGGYDFRRSAFFRGIGGTGFVLGKVIVSPPSSYRIFGPGLWFARLRQNMQNEIRHNLHGDRAGLAIILLTGDKTALSAATTEAMRSVGLAHLLAIAGLHVGLVAAIVFWLVRAVLAASPRLALHRPIKKWAALAALAAIIFYTLQVGAPVPTERALVMVGGVLIGILADRIVVSLRLIASAALLILFAMPFQLLNPSFQLSFAAVLALIACSEAWTHRAGPTESVPRRILRHIGGIIVMSGVAALATLPFSLYHFQEAGIYSMGANALAIPLTSLWLMPCCVFADLLWPFGLAWLPLRLLNLGLGLLIGIAKHIAALPGALYEPPPMPLSLLILAAAGGVIACLMASRMRWLGLGLYAIAVGTSFFGQRPNLLISADGQMIGWAPAPHQLAVTHIGKPDQFTVDIWAHMTGTPARNVAEKSPLDDDNCAAGACAWGKPPSRILWITDPMAIPDACVAKAALVLTPFAPWHCRQTPESFALDGYMLRKHGAYALYLKDGGYALDAVRDAFGSRPWSVGWRTRGKED